MTHAVKLSIDWFGPGATLWRAGDYPEMADNLIPLLPSSATVSDGTLMLPVKKFLDTAEGKKIAEEYGPKEGESGQPVTYEKAPGGKPYPQVAANGESEAPSSPKSSGPETQALPGQEVKTGNMVTASGSKPEEVAVEKAAAEKK